MADDRSAASASAWVAAQISALLDQRPICGIVALVGLSCMRAEGTLVNLTQRFEVSGAPGHCGC